MAQLPTDLLSHDDGLVGRGESCRLGRVRGGAQGARSHVRNGRGLPGGSGSRNSGRGLHVTSGGAADKRRRIASATPSSPRAKARVRAMASRGRRSCGASASNTHSTRSAQSAAHAATIRRSLCSASVLTPGPHSRCAHLPTRSASRDQSARRARTCRYGHPCAPMRFTPRSSPAEPEPPYRGSAYGTHASRCAAICGPTIVTSGIGCSAHRGGRTPAALAAIRAQWRSKPAGVQTST